MEPLRSTRRKDNMNRKKITQLLIIASFFGMLMKNGFSQSDNNVVTITPQIEMNANIDIAEFISNKTQNAIKTITAPVEIEKKEICILAAPNVYTAVANKNTYYYETKEMDSPAGIIYFNQSISYYDYGNGTCSIKQNGQNYYININDFGDENSYTEYDIDVYPGVKTIESYTAFGSRTPQAALQDAASDDELGFRRINNRYLVALGSRFTEDVGQYFDLVLENGTVIPCMLSDQKADEDTDPTNTYTISNGSWCCSEFCVDLPVIKSHGIDGDASIMNEGWNSRVAQIRVYNYNYFTN